MEVIYHARIYTLVAQNPVASAIAIEQGRVVRVGSDFEILNGFAHRARLLDAGGGVIIPGLTDAHIHLEQYALNRRLVDCETPSRAECLERVAQRARSTPPGGWILGHGWNQNDWAEGFGSAEELDWVAPQHAVFLTAKSLHAAWVNSLALQRAAITGDTPDPPGGRIGRDNAGKPNGILFEAAIELVRRAIPAVSPQERLQALREAIAALLKQGITCVHDFDGRECFVALQELHRNQELKLRVVKGIPWQDFEHARGIGLRSGFGDLTLRIGNLKLFSDGALGPRTAAMLQPYEGEPDNQGMLLLDGEEIYEIGRKALQSGFSLAVHAIGDRANHETLNALEQLRRDESAITGAPPTARHRIEHVQLIHPDDASRLAALGVVASMQPVHAVSDMPMAERYWGSRCAHAYAWRELLAHGTRLAFGSDAPVEPSNPFLGWHAATTRRRLDGAPGPQGWHPAQRLNRLEALQAFTIGPAYAAGLEGQLGKLAPGYLADLLLLGTDPLTCADEELAKIKPLAVMARGEWVYQS